MTNLGVFLVALNNAAVLAAMESGRNYRASVICHRRYLFSLGCSSMAEGRWSLFHAPGGSFLGFASGSLKKIQFDATDHPRPALVCRKGTV